jgi:TatD DNase family protein
MIDAHCHLNFQAFENEYERVIKDASDAGVHTIINAGTQVVSSKWALDLAEKFENLYAVIGVHPHHADKIEPNWLDELEKMSANGKVVGIGECGLDYFNYKSNGIVNPDTQKDIFMKQIELAIKTRLPLQIHSRTEKARVEVLDILDGFKNKLQSPPGMFHCIAGSNGSLKRLLDLGFYIGFDGNITYGTAPPEEPEELTELVKYAPIERIMIESDSPYLTPVPYRKEKNEPKHVIITAELISKIKGLSFEKVVEQTDKNVYTVFRKIKS